MPSSKSSGRLIDATLVAIEHLGYIQIDTISVVQRAHHHTLWNRNPRYKKAHFGELLENKIIFEYWSHTAAYLPMSDYLYYLRRKLEFKNGLQKHWYEVDEKLLNHVVHRIRAEGPLMVKDFEHSTKTLSVWESKPTKRALEVLYMRGELMISRRHNFHKVYDLTERVLADDVDRSMPTDEEHARFLITSYLRSNGLGQVNEMVYLLKHFKTKVSDAVH